MMTLKRFRKLTHRDLTNGAVLDELELLIEQRDFLLAMLERQRANIRRWIDTGIPAGRELLDPANDYNVALPPDRELLQELTAPKWTAPGGVVTIEKKDDVKKRLPNQRSPDKADAVILSSLLPPQET